MDVFGFGLYAASSSHSDCNCHLYRWFCRLTVRESCDGGGSKVQGKLNEGTGHTLDSWQGRASIEDIATKPASSAHDESGRRREDPIGTHMKIAILSDIHDNVWNLAAALQ